MTQLNLHEGCIMKIVKTSQGKKEENFLEIL